MKEELYCSHCGELIEDEDYGHINGEVICSDCIDRYCSICERCGAIIWASDSYGDDFSMSDEEMQKLSWSEFVEGLYEPELIQYLKERNLYVNETINAEEEL